MIEGPKKLSPQPRGEYVTDYYTLLERIAEEREVSGLALMSAWMTPRLQTRDSRWSNKVNIVVGNSFTDHVTFWNARSHLSVHLDTALITLKLSASDIEDDKALSAVAKIISKRIHISNSGSNSTVIIRSASHSVEELHSFVNKFQLIDRWNAYSHEVIESIDQVCPEETALAGAIPHVEDGVSPNFGDWHEVIFSEDRFRPPITVPRHIRDAPTLPGDLTRGAWALDFDIERAIDYSRFENIKHKWRLPRSLRLTEAFVVASLLGDRSNNHCIASVAKGGLLSLTCALEARLPEIKLPDDETALRYALCAPRDWKPFTLERGPFRNSLLYSMRPSDKGRYLKALIRLAGDIHSSRDIFLNKFWKHLFEFLGASTRMDTYRMPDLIQRLQKRVGSETVVGQEDWQRVAKAVQLEARSMRRDSRYLRFDFITEQFETFRNDYWQKNPPGSPRSEWDEWEKNSLAQSVQFLCEREILHQGHEWLCPRCNNTNWVSIDLLQKSLICDVCGQSKPAPVTDPWHFKLNAFVTEGIRSHGLLAELWCLSNLSDRAHTSFYFLEPHELFFLPPKSGELKADAEIDLLAVVDGKVHLCEAKTSNHVNVAKLASLARIIQPDVVTLAIMEFESAATRKRYFGLKELLEGSSIEVEVLVLQQMI